MTSFSRVRRFVRRSVNHTRTQLRVAKEVISDRIAHGVVTEARCAISHASDAMRRYTPFVYRFSNRCRTRTRLAIRAIREWARKAAAHARGRRLARVYQALVLGCGREAVIGAAWSPFGLHKVELFSSSFGREMAWFFPSATHWALQAAGYELLADLDRASEDLQAALTTSPFTPQAFAKAVDAATRANNARRRVSLGLLAERYANMYCIHAARSSMRAVLGIVGRATINCFAVPLAAFTAAVNPAPAAPAAPAPAPAAPAPAPEVVVDAEADAQAQADAEADMALVKAQRAKKRAKRLERKVRSAEKAHQRERKAAMRRNRKLSRK